MNKWIKYWWIIPLLLVLYFGLAHGAVTNWGNGTYSGNAIDTKPTGTVKEGTRFFELDTRLIWIMPTTGGVWTTVTTTN